MCKFIRITIPIILVITAAVHTARAMPISVGTNLLPASTSSSMAPSASIIAPAGTGISEQSRHEALVALAREYPEIFMAVVQNLLGFSSHQHLPESLDAPSQSVLLKLTPTRIAE